MIEFSVKTSRGEELVDITELVNRHVQTSQVIEGCCHLMVLHTTAALLINEAEPGLLDDYLDVLRRLVPASGHYAHPDGNAHAHIKAGVIGPSKTLPVRHGALRLGTWQRLFLAEFDGPRERRIVVQVVPVAPA